jgi:hypothetical protein
LRNRQVTMSGDRTNTFSFKSLSKSFNELEGYHNLSNLDLGNALESWNLLEEEHRQNDSVIANYQKWSFTASFLQLINAWQWFFSGVLLGRQAYLPAQTMQMYYYSIFFSYGSFLSAQFKGHYTLETKVEDMKTRKIRKEVWLDKNNGKNCIEIKDKGRGGEHEIRANWFYAVFKNWDFKGSHPDVFSFDSDTDFHSRFRNMYTYSLSDIAEELYTIPKQRSAPPNEVLISLWKREVKWVECYPEEFWALEHIKVAVDIHTRLLKEHEKSSPYKQHQVWLVKNLCAHHTNTGLIEVIREAIPIILQSIES